MTAHSFSVLWRVSVSGYPLLENLLALTYHLSDPGGVCFVLSYGTLSNDWVVFPQLTILPSYFFLSHSGKIIFLPFYVFHLSLFSVLFFSALIYYYLNSLFSKFPSGPRVRAWLYHHCGLGSLPGQGARALQTAWPKKKKSRIYACIKSLKKIHTHELLIFLSHCFKNGNK